MSEKRVVALITADQAPDRVRITAGTAGDDLVVEHEARIRSLQWLKLLVASLPAP